MILEYAKTKIKEDGMYGKSKMKYILCSKAKDKLYMKYDLMKGNLFSSSLRVFPSNAVQLYLYSDIYNSSRIPGVC